MREDFVYSKYYSLSKVFIVCITWNTNNREQICFPLCYYSMLLFNALPNKTPPKERKGDLTSRVVVGFWFSYKIWWTLLLSEIENCLIPTAHLSVGCLYFLQHKTQPKSSNFTVTKVSRKTKTKQPTKQQRNGKYKFWEFLPASSKPRWGLFFPNIKES